MFDMDTHTALGLVTDGWARYRKHWREHGWLLANPVELEKTKAHYAKLGYAYVIPTLGSMEVKTPAFPTSIPADNVMRLATLFVFHGALMHRDNAVREHDANPPDNHNLRVELLLGLITEDQMRVSIQMADKVYRKNRAVRQINQMVHAATVDIFRRYVASRVYEIFFTEIMALVNYSNGVYMNISKTYNNAVDCIELDLQKCSHLFVNI
jgi:hypothetical protein